MSAAELAVASLQTGQTFSTSIALTRARRNPATAAWDVELSLTATTAMWVGDMLAMALDRLQESKQIMRPYTLAPCVPALLQSHTLQQMMLIYLAGLTASLRILQQGIKQLAVRCSNRQACTISSDRLP